jgi:hypothetical protein
MRLVQETGRHRARQSLVRQDALCHDRVAAASGNALMRTTLERLLGAVPPASGVEDVN